MRGAPGLALVLALLLAAPAPPGWAKAARPRLRGVIEGFYGRPWTAAARRDVIAFLGDHGLDAFVYAPKNDLFHRERWREPYPDATASNLGATARAARAAGVEFVYALSPVLDVCYACRSDFRALVRKLRQLRRAGVRRFALLFDDGGAIVAPRDVRRFGGTDRVALGRAQAFLSRRTDRRLRARGLRGLALVVPTEYFGTECLPYHRALARGLPRRVPIAWTGPGVFAETITGAEARARGACLRRHPVVLWDNYPVNDSVLSNSLHLGPLTGRDADLPAALGGYLLNPMTQAHASLVAIGTAAAYLSDPSAYDAETAWADTLAELGGGGTGLATLAAQLRSSALDLRDARALGASLDGVGTTYGGAGWTPAVDALERETSTQAAAPADLDARLGGTPLGAEIAPWVTELAAHAARGTEAVRLLRAMKPALAAIEAVGGAGGLQVSGLALPPDTATADLLGPGFAAEADAVRARRSSPPLAAYLACLGDFLTADIGFCPQFGLNVHGKALYLLIRTPTDVALVTDRNEYDRLVLLVADAYAAWEARRGPGADALTLTLGGAPVPLAGNGAFSTQSPAANATLLLTTAAGEQTALDVP